MHTLYCYISLSNAYNITPFVPLKYCVMVVPTLSRDMCNTTQKRCNFYYMYSLLYERSVHFLLRNAGMTELSL